MSENRIASIDVQTTRFDPAEAEIAISVIPERPGSGLELRGRIVGPRCAYSETVEVAYPLGHVPSDTDILRARTIIPEPSFWDPVAPFLYESVVELWHDGQQVDRRAVTHGLRVLQITRRGGLLLNGKPFRLRGVRRNSITSQDAQHLRRAGCNLLWSRVTTQSAALWDAADRWGFFMLGQLDADNEEILWYAERELCHHPSVLGWLLPQSAMEPRQVWHACASVLGGTGKHCWMGVQVDKPGTLHAEAAFIVCDEKLLPELGETSVPKIVITREMADEQTGDESPAIWGRIHPELA